MADPYEDFNMTMAFAPDKYKRQAVNSKSEELKRNVNIAKNAPEYVRAVGQGLHDGAINTGVHMVNAANNLYQAGTTVAQGGARLGAEVIGNTPYSASYDNNLYDMNFGVPGQPQAPAMRMPGKPTNVKPMMSGQQIKDAQYDIDARAMQMRDFGHYANAAVQDYWIPKMYDQRNVQGAASMASELGTNALMASGALRAMKAVPGVGRLVARPWARNTITTVGTAAALMPWADRVFGFTTDDQGMDAQWQAATNAVNKVVGQGTVKPGDMARMSRKIVPAVAMAANPGMALVNGTLYGSGSMNPMVHAAGQYATARTQYPEFFPVTTAVQDFGKRVISDARQAAFRYGNALKDKAKALEQTYQDVYSMDPQMGVNVIASDIGKRFQDYGNLAQGYFQGAKDWWNSDSAITPQQLARFTGVYPSIQTSGQLAKRKQDPNTMMLSTVAQSGYAMTPRLREGKTTGQIAEQIQNIDRGVEWARNARNTARAIGTGIQAYNTGRNIMRTTQGDKSSMMELAGNMGKNYAVGLASDPANWVRAYDMLRSGNFNAIPFEERVAQMYSRGVPVVNRYNRMVQR